MAVAFSWTGYVDTDLAFSEFFNGDHTLTLRYMPQYPKGYEGPVWLRTEPAPSRSARVRTS